MGAKSKGSATVKAEFLYLPIPSIIIEQRIRSAIDTDPDSCKALTRRKRIAPIVLRCLGFVICLPFLYACSLQYVDMHGARHVWGFTHTVVKEAREARSEVVAQQVSTIGVSMLSLPEHSGFSVGYTRNFSIQISSVVEGGEFSFSPEDPTNFQYQDLITLIGGWKNEQTEPEESD